MLDGLFSDGSMFESMDEETRLKLANLLQMRIEYYDMINEVNRRKIEILMHPTADAEQDLAEYTSAVVGPHRAKMSADTLVLIGEAVDIDAIKSLVPAVLIGVSQSINFPLLFTVLGLDPDQLAEFVGGIKGFISDNSGL